MPKKYKPKSPKKPKAHMGRSKPMDRITKLNDKLRKKPTGPGRGKI